MIQSQGENLVFQLGIPRSGTTLLSVMLNNHPQVRCPPEPWIMLALNSLGLTHARDPADAPVLYRAFKNFCPPQATAKMARTVAVAAYNRCLKEVGKSILVDKTPRYYLILDYLLKVFPRARYVLLWRNPLDAALSMKTTWNFDVPSLLASRSDHPACIDLVLGLRFLRDFAAQHSDICYCLQYERLATDGTAQMNQLLDWLKLPPADGLDQFQLSGSDFASSEWGDKSILATSAPHGNSIGKWRHGFTLAEKAAIINGIGAELISEIGYRDVMAQAAGDGVEIIASEPVHATELRASLLIRRTEYDAAPTYADLSIFEKQLQQSLGISHEAAEAWRAPNLSVALQAYAKGAAVLTARDQERIRQLDQSRAELIAYQARIDENRESLARLGDQLSRGNAQWAAQVSTLEARLQSLNSEIQSKCERIELEQTARDSRHAELAAKLQASESQHVALESKNSALILKLTEGESQRTALESQCASLRAELDNSNQENAELARQTAEAAQKLAGLNESLSAARRQLAAEAARSQSLTQESTDLKNRLDVTRTELGEHKQARIELDWRLRIEQEEIEHIRGLLHDADRALDESARQYNFERAAASSRASAAAAEIAQWQQRYLELQNARLLRWGSKLGLIPQQPNGASTRPQAMEQAMASDSLVGNALKKLKHLLQSAAFPKKDDMDAAIEHLVAKGFRPKVVFDIGAAKGYWTERFAWQWKEAEFFLIDPLAESEPSLKALCQRENRFHYILAAVGRERGFLMMNVPDNHDSSSLLGAAGPNQRRVPIESIDALIAENKLKPPDLVKLDVQGFELSVLDGGQRMFDTAQAFIIEVNLWTFTEGCPRVHEVVQYMAQRKFFLFDIAGTLRRPFEDDLGQMDLVFVSEKSPMGASNRWA